jgi:hypothetical protein
MQVIPSEHCGRLRREVMLANVQMFAAQLDTIASLPQQARKSWLHAHDQHSSLRVVLIAKGRAHC